MGKLTVISGCPRSGTSIMSILIKNAVGEENFIGEEFPQDGRGFQKKLEQIKDGEVREYYEKKFLNRKKDDGYKDLNPDGFHECRYTVQGITWHQGMPDFTGRYAKVVSQGLAKSDPAYVGKIVYMVRDPHQVAKSQERLKRDLLDQTGAVIHSPRMYVEVTCQAAKWVVANGKAADVLLVNYDELIEEPTKICNQVSDFLGIKLDPSFVKPSLKRSTEGFVKHELFQYAETIHGFLLKGDWWSICDYHDLKVRPLLDSKLPVLCERLDRKVSHNGCRNCLSNLKVAENFKKEAVKSGIDWQNRPCMFLVLRQKTHSLTATVENNHWSPSETESAVGLRVKAAGITDTLIETCKRLMYGGKVMATPDAVKFRKGVCDGCAQKKGNTCKSCGCNLNVKIPIEASKCPEGKW